MIRRGEPLFLLMVCFYTACAAAKPDHLGLVARELSHCPSSPNCVSTQEERFGVAALSHAGSVDEARERLVEAISAIPRATIVTVSPRYVRAEVASRWLGFVDDLEAYVGDGTIHLRSESRTGYYDFQVNRCRIDEIRTRFELSKAR